MKRVKEWIGSCWCNRFEETEKIASVKLKYRSFGMILELTEVWSSNVQGAVITPRKTFVNYCHHNWWTLTMKCIVTKILQLMLKDYKIR